MTILVAYAPRPEGQAALEQGIEIAKQRKELLMVVNASPGGEKEDPAMADVRDYERVGKLLAATGIPYELKQFVRGKRAADEIQTLAETLPITLVVIGLRKRTAVGKLIMGSVSQEILLNVPCPVLAVKAG